MGQFYIVGDTVHAESKGEYGWPRVWRELRANSVRVWKERVRRLMKEHNIKARGKRKFIVTTDSKHSLPIAPNLLNRNFQPDAPTRVWVSDITYIQTDAGWLYLAVVLDLYRAYSEIQRSDMRYQVRMNRPGFSGDIFS